MIKSYNLPKSILMVFMFFACSNNDKMNEVKVESVGLVTSTDYSVSDSIGSYADSFTIFNKTYFIEYVDLISGVEFDTVILHRNFEEHELFQNMMRLKHLSKMEEFPQGEILGKQYYCKNDSSYYEFQIMFFRDAEMATKYFDLMKLNTNAHVEFGKPMKIYFVNGSKIYYTNTYAFENCAGQMINDMGRFFHNGEVVHSDDSPSFYSNLKNR